MARQYSPTQFFRRVPNGLLALTCKQRHGVLGEIDFEKFEETNLDPIFGVFTSLPDSKQAEIDGIHGKAMWTFLEHPGYWAGATVFLNSDNIAESSWKKRHNLPHLPPHTGPEDMDLSSRPSATTSTARRGGAQLQSGGLPPPR